MDPGDLQDLVKPKIKTLHDDITFPAYVFHTGGESKNLIKNSIKARRGAIFFLHLKKKSEDLGTNTTYIFYGKLFFFLQKL